MDNYSSDEQVQLLSIARQTLTAVTNKKPPPEVNDRTLSRSLRDKRACFISFFIGDTIRACTGTFTTQRSLAAEVSAVAAQTALNDPRYPPVTEVEAAQIQIKIAVLTPLKQLKFRNSEELLRLLRPGIDGVVLQLGKQRSTFLPGVWERHPAPVEFLTQLSYKMGSSGDAWRDPQTQIEIFQTIVIAERNLNTQ